MHKMEYVNARAKQSCKHEKYFDQSSVGSVLTLVVFFVLEYPLQRKEVCVSACVSLFCGGGNLGGFTGSDGFYRALSENTCLFAW